MKPKEQPKLSKEQLKQVRDAAWRKGSLQWKLDPTQQKVCQEIRQTTGGSYYFNKGRRIGGSYLLCVMALEKCLSVKGAKVKYAAPTAKAVRKIITPNIRKILADAPDDCKPKWINLEQEFRFPNGSTLEVAGCDNQQYENLRGTEADEIYLDEVGFMDELEYVVNDVLLPQIQDTGGRLIMTSTPPRSHSHPAYRIAMAHKASGRYSHKTVWDNHRRTREQHESFFSQMAESKNMKLEEYYGTATFRREYLGEFIADAERAVVPEWSVELESKVRYDGQHGVGKANRYVSLDIGFKDGMGALFIEVQPDTGFLYVVSEYLEFKKTNDQTAHGLKIAEARAFSRHKPLMRICDNNSPQFIVEMAQRGLSFVPVKKKVGGKEVMIAKLRDGLLSGWIRIHPRCTRLLTQLQDTMWNAARTEFERDEGGHGDLLDALIYACWMIRPDPVFSKEAPEQGQDRLVLTFDRRSEQDRKMSSGLSPLVEWLYKDAGDA